MNLEWSYECRNASAEVVNYAGMARLISSKAASSTDAYDERVRRVLLNSVEAVPQTLLRLQRLKERPSLAFRHELIRRVVCAKRYGVSYVPLRNTTAEMRHGRKCLVCGFTGEAVKKCSGCRWAYYCCRTCQKCDWDLHRAVCCPDIQLPQHVVGIPYSVVVAGDTVKQKIR